jgi:Zn-dependent alcohol dehydrogenase
LLASLLTLSDVFCTGHHAAVKVGVSPRTSVTVIGDGAVGLCAVLAARRLGAEMIVPSATWFRGTQVCREGHIRGGASIVMWPSPTPTIA